MMTLPAHRGMATPEGLSRRELIPTSVMYSPVPPLSGLSHSTGPTPTLSIEHSGGRMLSNGAETLARIQRAVTQQDRIIHRAKQLRPSESDLGSTQFAEENKLNIIEIPQFRPIEGRPAESVAALQEWEGLVVDVRGGVMIAELVDIANEHFGRRKR